MFMFGVLTTFVEWDSIHSTTGKKVLYMFTFPLFMLTYIPIALVALVEEVQLEADHPQHLGGRRREFSETPAAAAEHGKRVSL